MWWLCLKTSFPGTQVLYNDERRSYYLVMCSLGVKLSLKTRLNLACSFFSLLHGLFFPDGIKSNSSHIKVLYEELGYSVSLRDESQHKRLL